MTQVMHVLREFQAQHDDVVTDIVYDFYGTKLATCCSTKKVKVWSKKSDGIWICDSEIHTENDVQRLSWAHPEFGCILACCEGQDISIWEEDRSVTPTRWAQRDRWHMSGRHSTCVQFAPHHVGLWVAVSSADGMVRAWECSELNSLSSWKPMEPIDCDKHGPVTSLCWNPSAYSPPMLASASQSGVKIWEFSEKFLRFVKVSDLQDKSAQDVAWAPSMGRSFHLIATACSDHQVRIWKVKLQKGNTTKYVVECQTELNHHHAALWRVEWNITGTVLASTGDDGRVRLWTSDLGGNWHCTSVVGAGKDAVAEEKEMPQKPSQRVQSQEHGKGQQQLRQEPHFGMSGNAGTSGQFGGSAFGASAFGGSAFS